MQTVRQGKLKARPGMPPRTVALNRAGDVDSADGGGIIILNEGVTPM
jgi:hypothetical protein